MLEGHFIAGGKGKVFLTLRRAAKSHLSNECIVIAPPFAEEMNKCRKIITDFGIAACQSGISVAVPDLFGTGDSEGEFRHASWNTWQDDMEATVEWLKTEGFDARYCLAIRSGCLLAADLALTRIPEFAKSIFWQPVIEGRTQIRQLLRARVVASQIDGTGETMRDLEAKLQSGGVVEVSGYELPSDLYEQLCSRSLATMWSTRLGEVAWLATARDVERPVPRAEQLALEEAQEKQVRVERIVVQGDSYWSSAEIVTNHDLVSKSLEWTMPAS